MKKFFSVRNLAVDIDCVLLLIRIVTGFAFILHGWGKIQNPMNWMGPDSPVPGMIQFLGAFSEFGGGIALILGLVTRLAALGLGFTMIGAIYLHAFIMGDPFVKMGPDGGSFEPAAIYFLISLLLMVTGPGRYSLDKKIFK